MMSTDSDPIHLGNTNKTTYSYASVADTFFWGEKKQFLPRFQSHSPMTDVRAISVTRPHFFVVASSDSPFKED
jgi:hypothetical protein